MMNWLGKLIGIEGLDSVVGFDMQYAAPWAQHRPVLVLFCCLGIAALSFVFYMRYQGLRKTKAQVGMAIFRGVLLALFVWVLAEPTPTAEVRGQRSEVRQRAGDPEDDGAPGGASGRSDAAGRGREDRGQDPHLLPHARHEGGHPPAHRGTPQAVQGRPRDHGAAGRRGGFHDDPSRGQRGEERRRDRHC